MIKPVEARVGLEGAEPLVHRLAPEFLDWFSVDTIVRVFAADRQDDTAKLDVVAGSEFVDDRIRQLE